MGFVPPAGGLGRRSDVHTLALQSSRGAKSIDLAVEVSTVVADNRLGGVQGIKCRLFKSWKR